MSIRIATVNRPKSNASQWAALRAAVAATKTSGKAVSVVVSADEVNATRSAIATNLKLRAMGTVRTKYDGQTLTAWIESAK